MITYLKLGGSLITDKSRPNTIRRAVIRRLAQEIKSALAASKDLRLILGHGSGSFGHVPASHFHTRQGVKTAEQWRGFAQVHYEAAALNRILITALRNAGIDALTFDPLSLFTASSDDAQKRLSPIFEMIGHGIVPVVYGDAVLDKRLGGTILSTEEVFALLAKANSSQARWLLAGDEPGIWRDYPARKHLIKELDVAIFNQKHVEFIQGASAVDVTGGMLSKVETAASLLNDGLAEEVIIFSGLKPGNVHRALLGEVPGTRLIKTADKLNVQN